MASVRNTPAFSEIAPVTATFKIDSSIVPDLNRYDLGLGSAQVNDVVTLTSDSTCGLGSAGNFVLGQLLKVEPDGNATVQIGGVINAPYNTGGGTPPLVGRGIQVDGTGLATTPAGGVRLATERGIVLMLTTDEYGNHVAKVWLP